MSSCARGLWLNTLKICARRRGREGAGAASASSERARGRVSSARRRKRERGKKADLGRVAAAKAPHVVGAAGVLVDKVGHVERAVVDGEHEGRPPDALRLDAGAEGGAAERRLVSVLLNDDELRALTAARTGVQGS